MAASVVAVAAAADVDRLQVKFGAPIQLPNALLCATPLKTLVKAMQGGNADWGPIGHADIVTLARLFCLLP